MNTQKAKTLFFKTLSLLSVIRGYNILVLIAAQYLAAIFIFSEEKSLKNVILDQHLLYIVFATVCVIAAGYIINNFYDVKADRINRPIKTGLDSYVKQETKLTLYFFLNFTSICFGVLVSWRAALFFTVYIFGIWLYSHKLKKHPISGLLAATCLTVLPFFAIFVHYKNFSKVIFVHASFLFLVVMIRELVKDLENIKGAIANNYTTFAVKYGEKHTKHTILFLLLLTLVPAIILFNYRGLDNMKYYFYAATFTLIFIGIYTIKATKKNEYRLIHNILKILLLVGVFSLLLIDREIILDKVVHVLD